jgi:hypothetical protein
MTSPYKEIWEEDTTPTKVNAKKYFRYIELLCSPKRSNIYSQLSEEDRVPRVKKEVFNDPNYPIPHNLLMATIIYKEHLTTYSLSYNSLIAAENSLFKLQTFLTTFDPATKTPSGALLLKPKELILATKELPLALDRLKEAKAKVLAELTEATVKTTNEREVGLYEE